MLRRSLPALCILILISVGLTGCSFWDWLAGVPVTDRAARGEIPPPATGPDGQDENTGDGQSSIPSDDDSDDDNDSPRHGQEGGPPPVGSGTGSGTSGSGPFPSIELRPVDESHDHPSMREFRQQFESIISKRDVEGLLAVVDPNIKNDFGGNDGVEAFKTIWKLNENPENSEVWTVLQDIVSLGGVFLDEEQTLFVAPYVYALYDLDLDPFTHSVVTGEGVNVRTAPDTASSILETVSYIVVRVLPTYDEELPTIDLEGRTYQWAKVQLPSGTIGYMVDRYLWSPVGYRLAFSRQGDQWRLIYLLAGD